MKQLKISLLFAGMLFTTAFANAQTADEVINKHLDAIGGKDILSKITSLYVESTIQAMGNESPSVTTILNGKGTRTDVEMMGSKIINVYTDKGGWLINPMAGASDPTAMPDEQYKAGEGDIYISPLLDYATKGSKVELAGQEKVGDIDAYKLKYINKDNFESIYYIDPTTYYILQEERTISMMGQDMQMVIIYSDYKRTDAGLVFPNTIEINYGSQFSMTSTLKKIEINKAVDVTIFDMPK